MSALTSDLSPAGRYLAARMDLLARSGRPGPTTRARLTALTDDWLKELFDLAGAAQAGATLVAVGGYGRGELSAGSDLDLLLLHAGGRIAEVADQMWYPIWDSGLRLDHSVRTASEARRMAATDIKVVLGLLDARTVAGDDSTTSALKASVLADWRALAPERLPDLQASVRDRDDRQRRARPPARARPQGVLRRASGPDRPAGGSCLLGHGRPARRAGPGQDPPAGCPRRAAPRRQPSDRPIGEAGAGSGRRSARSRRCGRAAARGLVGRPLHRRGQRRDLACRRPDRPLAAEVRVQAPGHPAERAQPAGGGRGPPGRRGGAVRRRPPGPRSDAPAEGVPRPPPSGGSC